MKERASDKITAQLAKQLEQSGLTASDSTVLIGVSGGLDSVCLLHLLRFAAAPTRLIAAHYDHRMRADSARDAEWVRGLCRAWSIPFQQSAAVTSARSEAEARTQRYGFLEAAADEHAATWIVTAHHADDQAETVLFRLARGTGLAGLAGIAARRGRILRPLLDVTRDELRAYAREHGLSWRDDPTNRDLKYARNWIRARVLPALESASPGATRRIAGLARRAAEAEAGWDSVVRQAVQNVVIDRDESTFALARDRLLLYHPHVRARVIRHLLRVAGGSPNRVGIATALRFAGEGVSGTQVELAGHITFSREFDRLLLGRAQRELPDTPLIIGSIQAGDGSFRLGGRTFEARWTMTARPADIPNERTRVALFDPAALRFPLALRGWRPGDRIRLSYGSKKLKELFRERRIGRATRARVPVLLDADGRVLWVVGVARAQDTTVPAARAFEISVRDGATS